MSKQFGLILPNKDKGHKIAPVTNAKPSIFNEDSDSDAPDTRPTGLTKVLKRQDKINRSKAVEEDPTVYQYDEIYDEMDQQRKESKLSRRDLDKKPKYINKLLAAAEKRKRENERRIERQVQKEREEEGEEFKDKESFVTSAYKKKLEEMRELEEQEKREEYLESIGDVRKQGNLDGFYRHLYDQKVNYDDKKDEDIDIKKEVEVKDEPKSDGESSNKGSPKQRRSSESQSEPDTKKIKKDTKRKYRARQDSEDEEENEAAEVKKEHLPSNLDADSDFSIDSSDSEDEADKGEKSKKENEQEAPEKINEESEKLNGSEPPVKENSESVVTEEAEEKKVEVKPKKPKVDIWKKRTVGEKFDEALKRYFERKALREAGL